MAPARLANAAAHEINNPLTMVLGRLAMLREVPSLPAEARDRIGQVHAAAERIREIVVDMNHLTRVQLCEHASRSLLEMLDIGKSAEGASPPPQGLSKRPGQPKQAPRFGQFGNNPDGHHARATALRTRRQPAASEPTATPLACAGRLIPRGYALS